MACTKLYEPRRGLGKCAGICCIDRGLLEIGEPDPGMPDTLQHPGSHTEELSLPIQELTSILSAERVLESRML